MEALILFLVGHEKHGPCQMGGGDIKIPDWRIYKVENAPELMQVERALASHGLRDPWLRNEVWRYNKKEFGTHGERLRLVLFRGFKWGLLAAVGTVLVEKAFFSSDDHHH
ncbi:NADH dehydrogenase [ubiquinone] 1 beta subcomplex subunit 3-like isoform X1 [Scylla paramamosain]|uniref:NADH dehydrogenase [ubiquinone] 1 beta subcomplex subunit 3-like isoform X1 n=1 Tax=Scylla paramamosain TaxID=85552 RepID=UPI003083EDF0